MGITNVDNQVDKIIDKVIDNQIESQLEFNFLDNLVFVPIQVSSTEVIQILNYPLFNGFYVKGYDVNIGYYFINENKLLWYDAANANNVFGWRLSFNFTEPDAMEDLVNFNLDTVNVIPIDNWITLSNFQMGEYGIKENVKLIAVG